jgi:hypothetical protein
MISICRFLQFISLLLPVTLTILATLLDSPFHIITSIIDLVLKGIIGYSHPYDPFTILICMIILDICLYGLYFGSFYSYIISFIILMLLTFCLILQLQKTKGQRIITSFIFLIYFVFSFFIIFVIPFSIDTNPIIYVNNGIIPNTPIFDKISTSYACNPNFFINPSISGINVNNDGEIYGFLNVNEYPLPFNLTISYNCNHNRPYEKNILLTNLPKESFYIFQQKSNLEITREYVPLFLWFFSFLFLYKELFTFSF